MTPDLNSVSVFVKVAQAGSFTQAARLLQMPITTVSAKVASLERELSVTLLQRTTRRLHLTQAGEVFFKKCITALESLDEATRELTATQEAPQGILKITAPVDVGQTLLPELVRIYLQKYPRMQVELVITNRRVDLITEGVDLAIRAGKLEDSSFIAKKFTSINLRIWGSPAYLKKKGVPEHPRDLRHFNFVKFSYLDSNKLALSRGQEKFTVSIRGPVQVDDLPCAKAFTKRGIGLGILPAFLCREEETSGKLVCILPDWQSNAGSLFLVYPSQKFLSAKVSGFLEIASLN